MKLTTEQAKALLEMDPFVIVRLVIDDEGYQDTDMEPWTMATNAAWGDKELTKFVRDEIDSQELGSDLRSCVATYLCQVKHVSSPYPYYDSYWEMVEAVLLSTEPVEYDAQVTA